MDIIPQVNLFTAEGGFVGAFKDAAMAQFGPVKPEVLFWGAQIFKRVSDTCYVETFFYELVLPSIEIKGEEPVCVEDDSDVFLVNDNTGEIHHKNCIRAACQLHEIKQLSVAPSLVVARENGGDLCAWCFKSRE
jgi:hypothetical protein